MTLHQPLIPDGSLGPEYESTQLKVPITLLTEDKVRYDAS